MGSTGTQSREELKLAVTEIQRQLKAAGSRIVDAKRQLSDGVDVLAKFRYLRPSVGKMAGCDSLFLELKGTVQMKFHERGYFVPLAVYLRNDHPESPPVCIIQPTPEMMIKPNHHHVDVHGLVYLPYLHEWSNSSNVVDMLLALEVVFGREPFIFKKPTLPAGNNSGGGGGRAAAAAGSSASASESAASVSSVNGARPCSTAYQRSQAEKAKDAEALRQAAAYCERLSGTDLMEALRKKANEVEEVDAVLEASFRCPISMEIMTEPVFAADGHTYEKVEMERWLQTHETSPLTNEKLPHKKLITNQNLRNQIQAYQSLGRLE